ncbi:hypothetical protein PENSPDRAFT_736353 [Peniophora sp. CONT]|nr:hypothetical protein PENSPDRAFT_736353 [Peniophora sp. CONT]
MKCVRTVRDSFTPTIFVELMRGCITGTVYVYTAMNFRTIVVYTRYYGARASRHNGRPSARVRVHLTVHCLELWGSAHYVRVVLVINGLCRRKHSSIECIGEQMRSWFRISRRTATSLARFVMQISAMAISICTAQIMFMPMGHGRVERDTRGKDGGFKGGARAICIICLNHISPRTKTLIAAALSAHEFPRSTCSCSRRTSRRGTEKRRRGREQNLQEVANVRPAGTGRGVGTSLRSWSEFFALDHHDVLDIVSSTLSSSVAALPFHWIARPRTYAPMGA